MPSLRHSSNGCEERKIQCWWRRVRRGRRGGSEGTGNGLLAETHGASDQSPVTRPAAKASATKDLSAPLGSAYMEDRHVQWLMSHLGELRGKVIASPSVMVLNGREAQIRQVNVQPYLRSVEPTTRPTGDVLYQPKSENVEDGITFGVRAVVSQDRKYVTLHLKPIVSKLLGMDQFTVHAQHPSNR